MRKPTTEQEANADQREGEDGFELSDEDEAALAAAWAKERTPEFLERIKRQEIEYDKWINDIR